MRRMQNSILFFSALSLYILSTAAQSEEDVCVPGEFRDTDDRCVKCPENTYSSIANARKCRPCPRLRVSKRGSNAFERCKPCGPGRFFAVGVFKPGCRRCPDDTFNDRKEVSKCKPCPKGTVSAKGTRSKNDCMVCPVGTVVTRRAGRGVTCAACSDGKTTFEENAKTCSNCPEGTFRDRVFSPGTGCQPCRPGTFANKKGFVRCKACKKGFYQPSFGGKKCIKCPKNSGTKSTAGKSCRPTCLPGSPGCNVKACPPGFGLNSETRECEKCPPGQVSPTLSTTPCYVCPTGEGTVNPDKTDCVCEPGFRLRVDGKCEKCPSGITNEDGSTCMCLLNKEMTECTCPSFSKKVGDMCLPCQRSFCV